MLILDLVLSKKMFEKELAKLSVHTLTMMTQISKCVASNYFATPERIFVSSLFTLLFTSVGAGEDFRDQYQ